MKILPPFINNKIHHALPILEKRNILTIFLAFYSRHIFHENSILSTKSAKFTKICPNVRFAMVLVAKNKFPKTNITNLFYCSS